MGLGVHHHPEVAEVFVEVHPRPPTELPQNITGPCRFQVGWGLKHRYIIQDGQTP